MRRTCRRLFQVKGVLVKIDRSKQTRVEEAVQKSGKKKKSFMDSPLITDGMLISSTVKFMRKLNFVQKLAKSLSCDFSTIQLN